ncbi:hypothetical protein LQ327_22645 [Actinomycetospora endophytica]|uniref:Uncharacterized protein n=1 Tax=Actinomycetospora endophytica TaxID=2291215 RepID=A0ABS8PD22_9PSEU|nr:hypothetical protein [Actinomycetospora endophytica]MCD2196176.1 hypothetical protein [Actinomycetospora endophytica]
MVENKSVDPQPRIRAEGPLAVHPTRGASLVTGALVVGAVVGGSAGYRVGNLISHRHGGPRPRRHTPRG